MTEPSRSLLDALIQQESGGNRDLVSSAGALGLMQVMPETAKNPGFGIRPVSDFSHPELERLGREYLGAMLDRYPDDTEAALIGYNAGPGNADKWLAAGRDYGVLPKREETEPYTQNILAILRQSEQRTGQGQNEYRALIQRDQQRADTRLNMSLKGAVESNPDKQAEIIKLSDRTGVPARAVESQFDEISQRETLNEFQDLIRDSPKLKEFLSNPENSKAAHDDIQNLATFEQWFARVWGVPTGELEKTLTARAEDITKPGQMLGDMGTAFRSGRAVTQQSEVIGRIRESGSTPELEAELKALQNTSSMKTDEEGLSYFLDPAARLVGNMLDPMLRAAETGVTAGMSAAGVAAALGQIGPQVLTPEELITVPSAFLAAFTPAFVARTAVETATIEGNLAWQELKDMAAEAGAEFDVETANHIAAGVGFINGALETVGTMAVGRPFVKAANTLLRRRLNAALRRPTIRKAWAEFGKNYLLAVGAETGTEVAQELVTLAGGEVYKAAAEGEFEDLTDAEVIERITGIFSEVLRGMAVLALPGASINLAVDYSKAQRAERQVQVIEALGSNAEASKLRARLPEKYKEFVDSVVQDGEVDSVFIEGEAIAELFQSEQIDPDADLSQIPGLAAQIDEARATGGFVEIKLGVYQSYIAGTEMHLKLAKSIKFRVDDMTADEAKAFGDDVQVLLEQERAKAEQTAEQQAELDEPVTKIETRVREQLIAGGTAPEIAAQQAALHAANARVLQSKGIDPEEIYGTLDIRTEAATEPGAVTFEQSAVPFMLNPLPTAPTGGVKGTVVRIRDVAQALTDSHFAKHGRVLDPKDEADYALVLGDMREEFEHQLNQEDTGESWYVEDINEALRATEAIIPELADPNNRDLFLTLAAIMSPQERPGPNWEKATQAMQGYVADGVVPLRKENGTKFGLASDYALPLLNHLIQTQGLEEALTWVITPKTGREMAEMRRDSGIFEEKDSLAKYTPSEVNLQDVLPGVYVFGPKVGDFMQNATGYDPEAVTVDLWLSRTYNRHIGRLLDVSAKVEEKGGLADAPRGRGERMLIKQLIGDIAKQNEMEASAVQAALWYFEQRLFRNHGIRSDTGTFSGAAETAVQKRAPAGAEGGRGAAAAAQAAAGAPQAGVTELAQRQPGEPPTDTRGSIQFYDDQTVINLGKSANLSTFLHESGHLFVRTLMRIADRDEQAAADLQAMIKFAGVETAAGFETVDAQEKLARAFEAYLREGKAPSVELQGAFRRFRSWLMLVYRQLVQLDVELDDEIRGVFDRMLATEEEIAAAEQSSNFVVDPALLELMDEPAQRRYNEAAEKATAAAVEELERRKAAEALRETKAWWRAELAVVKKEVTEEIDAQPIYSVIAILRDKDNGVFLARDAVEDEYGPEVLKKLTFLTRKEGGVHPDIVAAGAGLTSGDEMIKGILAAPARGKAIEDETTRRMNERHGTLLESKRQAVEAAGEAVHSDERAKFLAAELIALAKKAGKGKATPAQVAKRVAQQLLERRTVQDAIKVGQYRAQELKAAREAQKAVSEGDFVAATNAKRGQLLNHYLYMEALKAKEEVEKHLRYFKKFDKKGTRAAIDPDYLAQIDGLLERHEFRKVSLKTLAGRKSLAKWIEERTAEGDEVIIPEELAETLSRVNYKEMTLEQLRGLNDAVKNIEHLGRLKNRLLTDKKKREMQAAEDAIVGSIAANNEMRPPESIAPKYADRIKAGLSRVHAAHTKLEFLFHRLGGEKIGNDVWTLLFKPIADAETAEQDMMTNRVIPGLNKIFGRYSRRERAQWMTKRIFMPELNDSLTKANILALALNMGNEDNRVAVYEGLGLGPEASEEAVWRILGRHMTEKDWQTVQAIWDHIDSFWDDIAALQKELAGVVPEKVERVPIETAYGTLPGGYYPLKADSRFSHKAHERAQKEGATTDELFSQNWMRPQTRKGHTIERVGFGGQRVSLDLSVVTEHLTNVVHDLTHRKALIDVDKLSRRNGVRDAITSAAGRESYNLIRPWLTAVAGDRKEPATYWDRTLGRLRTGATVVNMGFKVTTAIVQPMGFFNSVERLGPKWAMTGLRKFFANPLEMREKVDFVMQRSVMMQNRQKTFDRDVRDALKKMKVVDSATYEMRQTFFYFTGLLDMSVSMPTWLGAYEQAMAEFDGDEAKAIDHADSTVRMTQSAGGIKDLAQIQRGSETMRIFTMFYSYFSVLYNQFAAAGGRVKSVKNVPAFLASMMWLWIVPSVLSEIVAGRGPEDDEDTEGTVRWTARNLFQYPFQAVIGLRDIVNAVSQAIEPNAPQYGYSFSPVVQGLETTSRLPKQIAEGELDRQLLKTTLMTIGYWAALPARQAWITGEYLYDYATGKEDDFSVRDLVFPRRK